MNFNMSLRSYVFIFFAVLFHFVLAGFLTPFASLPITVFLAVLVHYQSFEQLPPGRLSRFAAMLGVKFTEDSDTNDDRLKSQKGVILHRGGAIDAPENTLEAIREAAKHGVAGVEIDLQFTADGVGILLHDDTLERTTDGTGDVRKKKYSDLLHLNAAAKHKTRDQYPDRVKIPTLEECLMECIEHKMLVFIDCKAFPNETADLLDDLFNKYPDLYDTAVVCSFSSRVIYIMRNKNPEVITALTYRQMALSTEQDCETPRFTGIKHYIYTCADYLNMLLIYGCSWYLCGNSFLLLNKESLCRNEVIWWKRLGVQLLPWTVNSEVEKRYITEYLKLPIITDGLDSQ